MDTEVTELEQALATKLAERRDGERWRDRHTHTHNW